MENMKALENLAKILDKFPLEAYLKSSTRVIARIELKQIGFSFSYGASRSNEYYFKFWLRVRGEHVEFQINNPLFKFGWWKKELAVWNRLVAVENFLIAHFAKTAENACRAE